jgi:1,4-dihydroxy-2-naphthoyl-CoA hydrolase
MQYHCVVQIKRKNKLIFVENKNAMKLSKEIILNLAEKARKGTLMETLDIEFIDAGEDFLTARMPVNERVLHGGATFALAETVGSFAAHLINHDRAVTIRGIEMSGNHLKSVSSGFVYATARAVHNGRTTQLFQVEIKDDHDRIISICKLTTIAIDKTK